MADQGWSSVSAHLELESRGIARQPTAENLAQRRSRELESSTVVAPHETRHPLVFILAEEAADFSIAFAQVHVDEPQLDIGRPAALIGNQDRWNWHGSADRG